MTDYKIKQDLKNLLKMGLPEDMAMIVAHANNGKPEDVQYIADQMSDEHHLILEELCKNNFVPFSESLKIVDLEDESDEKPVRKERIKNVYCFECKVKIQIPREDYVYDQFYVCLDCNKKINENRKNNTPVSNIDESDKENKESDL
jgi:hypothetical protein